MKIKITLGIIVNIRYYNWKTFPLFHLDELANYYFLTLASKDVISRVHLGEIMLHFIPG